jgi:para-aminobenzoate synthetase component 1
VRESSYGAPVMVRVTMPVEISCAFHLARESFGAGSSFLLDSALPSQRLGRHSFLGGDPFARFRAWRIADEPPGSNARMELQVLRDVGNPAFGPAGVRTMSGDPYEVLADLLGTAPDDESSDTPLQFMSGAVGYLGYEAGQFSERYGKPPAPGAGPDIELLFVDGLVAHEHASGHSYVVGTGWGATAEEARGRATARAGAVRQRIDGTAPPTAAARAPRPTSKPTISSYADRGQYDRWIDDIKTELLAGNAYEICLTHQLDVQGEIQDPWRAYCLLREISPAPFAAYLDLPDVVVVSSSPERFVQVDANGTAESRPIKGTRPRGRTPQEDWQLTRDLAMSEKDLAENVMIVDLVRNDFGRVCRPGSVEVSELFCVEEYATVLQMVSTVQGVLDDGFSSLDLVRASFPGGSMTGAPKISAMDIIARLEPRERGIYSGALGYFDFGGAIDLSIVIRTLVLRDGHCTYGTGGAIVMDSDAGSEYEESHHKARALRRLLDRMYGDEKPGSVLITTSDVSPVS